MKTMMIEPVDNFVQSMRKIRDEISDEIKDMSFEEERAFLDRLLKSDQTAIPPKNGTPDKK